MGVIAAVGLGLAHGSPLAGLAARGPLSLSETTDVIAQIASALAAASSGFGACKVWLRSWECKISPPG